MLELAMENAGDVNSLVLPVQAHLMEAKPGVGYVEVVQSN
jgi:hypothetical protein